MQILQLRPQLRSLAFPTLFSELTSHLWSIPYCLLLSCNALLFGLPSRIEAPDATETGYIYHESPTMSFNEVTVLVCIHSSIHSTNVYWEPIMCQNPFYIYAKDMNSSLLLNGLHLNDVRRKNMVFQPWDWMRPHQQLGREAKSILLRD